MSEELTDPRPPPRQSPLPVTITPGMSVVPIDLDVPAAIVGITQEYCIHRFEENGLHAVARWQDVALANVRPAEPLLPADVSQLDRDNASAAVLRELLNLQQFGLTPTQTATIDELLAELTDA